MKVLTSTYSKIWIILGCFQFWNPFFWASHFFLSFLLPQWFLTFPLCLMSPTLCGFLNFAGHNPNSSYVQTFKSTLPSIICSICWVGWMGGGRGIPFFCPNLGVIAGILWFSLYCKSIPRCTGCRDGGLHYCIPCWNTDLKIMMGKSTLITVLFFLPISSELQTVTCFFRVIAPGHTGV